METKFSKFKIFLCHPQSSPIFLYEFLEVPYFIAIYFNIFSELKTALHPNIIYCGSVQVSWPKRYRLSQQPIQAYSNKGGGGGGGRWKFPKKKFF